MEYYKVDHYDPETFEKTEFETQIPTILVRSVRSLLEKLDHTWTITPIMYNPKDKSVCFGFIDLEDRSKKYRISIAPVN